MYDGEVTTNDLFTIFDVQIAGRVGAGSIKLSASRSMVATSMFGADWAKRVIDIDVTLFNKFVK